VPGGKLGAVLPVHLVALYSFGLWLAVMLIPAMQRIPGWRRKARRGAHGLKKAHRNAVGRMTQDASRAYAWE
jgi:hypothetical protein